MHAAQRRARFTTCCGSTLPHACVRASARATGPSVDLAVLGASAPVLAFEVLEGGRRVFARDAYAVDAIEESLLRRYLDTEHLRRVQREYFLGAKR